MDPVATYSVIPSLNWLVRTTSISWPDEKSRLPPSSTTALHSQYSTANLMHRWVSCVALRACVGAGDPSAGLSSPATSAHLVRSVGVRISQKKTGAGVRPRGRSCAGYEVLYMYCTTVLYSQHVLSKHSPYCAKLYCRGLNSTALYYIGLDYTVLYCMIL